jgi:pseudouridine synthase
VEGQSLKAPKRLEYWLLNKPGRMVTTMSDPQKRPCVGEIIEAMGRKVVPAGRLDFNSTGALLLTNDGEMAARLTHPRWHVEKIYQVKVDRDPGEGRVDRLRKGVRLDDGMTAPAYVRVVRTSGEKAWLEVRIGEGRNRQVRRMFEAVGLTVEKLRRTAIGPIKLGRLPTGSARHLTAEELRELRAAVGL